MSESVTTILIALAQHRATMMSEETGRWRTLCRCGVLVDDDKFELHVAEEVDAALHPRVPLYAYFADGTPAEQLTLEGMGSTIPS